ncbi:DUF1329 domain-containing protein [Pseudoxanthomonas sp. CAU 1598]|uniref:DUF1329 domain-containing protein n=2 Tax=Pseudomarimonas arenosa TaxID=2774145 RepID=A0AAW3ZPC7_9GAMM|nr:DUF1329 domain-containing protein [Pseudomarimonas arenosa]
MAAFTLLIGCAVAHSAADPAQLAKLGNELTPVGAQRAGDASLGIPDWEGGVAEPPAGFVQGEHHRDPFPSDRPTRVLTRANLSEHRDQLSAGQLAMFDRHPGYKMPIYPSRRSAAFPQRTYEYTLRNARTAQLAEGGDAVVGAAEGFPFPVPRSGHEAIWNHKLKYKGVGVARWNNQAALTANGSFNLVRLREEVLGLYYKPGSTIDSINNVLFYFFQSVEAPPRLAGQVLLVHETLDQVSQPRQAWIYNPGQRRVRRAPNIAYDNPGTASDGLRTNDMSDMFNGAFDRFDWKLLGKRVMYVPYNAYRLHSDQVTAEQILQPGFVNPDLQRYELHRVWVVEASLMPGKRHINSRRTFYLDEDSWQIMLVDHYDGQGRLWRLSEAPSISYYEVPTFWSTLEIHNDLLSGRYLVSGLDNQESMVDFQFQATPGDFAPQSLRVSGIR